MRRSTFIMKSRSLDIRGVGGTIQHYTTYIWYIIRPGFEKKRKGRKILEFLLKDILKFGVLLKG